MDLMDAMVDCECKTWARVNPTVWTGHHDRCEKFNAGEELRRLVVPLLDGIQAWAADEDGVHCECWDAFQAACWAIGEQDRIDETKQD